VVPNSGYFTCSTSTLLYAAQLAFLLRQEDKAMTQTSRIITSPDDLFNSFLVNINGQN